MVVFNYSTGQKILIVSDAWEPQINGVVTTLSNLRRELEAAGNQVKILSHKDCHSKMSVPFHPELKELGRPTQGTVGKWCRWAHAIHIATPEGPMGLSALWYCYWHRMPFTTGYHTKWPEYMKEHANIPEAITRSWLRFLHRKSSRILVPTDQARKELEDTGYKRVQTWTRGVDRSIFNPSRRQELPQVGRPFVVCVSRVSAEKNLEAFCELDFGDRTTKVLVGDGPHRASLEEKYPDVIFPGMLTGIELAQWFASADCFVFPSKTDTFGVVMIEAMACGTPVAAYPVTGPTCVVDEGVTGCLNEDLHQATQDAMQLSRSEVARQSAKWCWKQCADDFVDYLVYR